VRALQLTGERRLCVCSKSCQINTYNIIISLHLHRRNNFFIPFNSKVEVVPYVPRFDEDPLKYSATAEI
jgi:hypothetical protein